MVFEAVPVILEEIQSLRSLFLHESHCQIRYDACHRRGWTDSYLLAVNGKAVGYGSVKGEERRIAIGSSSFTSSQRIENRRAGCFWHCFASKCRLVESQTNVPLLTALLHEFATEIATDTILFEDESVTEIVIPGAIVRPRSNEELLFEHGDEPEGSHVLEFEGELVASGGFLLHYNLPFADLYMEVRADRRRRGFGAFLVQEVKRQCYLSGRVPAAHCNHQNEASRDLAEGRPEGMRSRPSGTDSRTLGTPRLMPRPDDTPRPEMRLFSRVEF